MIGEGQNSKSHHQGHLRDVPALPTLSDTARFYSKFYNRTNKLITALYMVTDVMDKEEPLRGKLRSLGTSIVSDIYSVSSGTSKKIEEVLSFLEIASVVGMISEMNHGILKKEFLALQGSLKESEASSIFFQGHPKETSLLNFLDREEAETEELVEEKRVESIGRPKHARIGVQKGGTLMKALSDRIPILSDMSLTNYNVLKKEREDEIIRIIKNKGQEGDQNLSGVTITDIKNSATGVLASTGEKTLQRQLVSMVKEGTLKKTGEKRWSRYFLAPPGTPPPF